MNDRQSYDEAVERKEKEEAKKYNLFFLLLRPPDVADKVAIFA
jgi:hypothetical protein